MGITGILIGGGVLVVTLGCARAAGRNALVERPMGTLATVRVPKRLEPRPALLQDWFGTSLYLTRSMNSFSAMGSNAPMHENLLITQFHPVMVHRRGEELLANLPYVFEYTSDIVWEPSSDRNGYRIRFGVGRYTPNTMDKPALLAQAFSVAKGVAVSYRGLADDTDQEAIGTLIDSAMASYKATVDLPTYFAAITRHLAPGLWIALPIELTDPFPWQQDSSGVQWMYFRRHREWSEDPNLPEQAVAITAFFHSGDAPQAAAALHILSTRADGWSEPIAGKVSEQGDVTVEEVRHIVNGRGEMAWLAYSIDLSRGVAVAYRCWQKNLTAKGAAEVVSHAIESYYFAGAPDFFNPPTP